jgi:hypothetical protein
VTHTARCQPRSTSIRRPAEISALKSAGGSTSRSETNSSRQRTPGSRSGSAAGRSGRLHRPGPSPGPGRVSRAVVPRPGRRGGWRGPPGAAGPRPRGDRWSSAGRDRGQWRWCGRGGTGRRAGRGTTLTPAGARTARRQGARPAGTGVPPARPGPGARRLWIARLW